MISLSEEYPEGIFHQRHNKNMKQRKIFSALI
jgi:hypothetical protein